MPGESIFSFPDLPRPRAVYCAFELFPRPKGASSHIASMVTALAARHGPVWLLCCGHGDMPRVQVDGGVVVLRHMTEEPEMLRRAQGFGAFVHEVCAGLRAAGDPVEVVVFRDPWGGTPALQSGLAARFVFEVNALPSWELGYRYPGFRRRAPTREKVRDLERFCLREADAVLTVSPVTARALEARGVDPGRVAVTTNAAAAEFFAPPADCPVPELTAGRWIGYFGSLHPWQGVDVALEAWRLVEADLPDVRLAVIHAGRKRPFKRLLRLARDLGLAEPDRVLFVPPLEPAGVAAALGHLELSLAPLTETFRNTVQGCCPVKIVESMAAGVPVVASDLRVNRALVTPEVDGVLVPPGSPRALALALRDLLRDEPRRARLAAAAAATARRRFTHEVVHAGMAPVFAGGAPGVGYSGDESEGRAP